MDDLKTAFEAVADFLPESVAGWALTILTTLFAIGILVNGLSWLTKPLAFAGRQFRKLELGQRRREAAKRDVFIDSLIGRVEQINANAEWADRRYTELEAEVEAEGNRTGIGPVRRLLFSSQGRRRERTLGKALQTSRQRLILLQGDPGSGKSVALRHVALDMAKRAKGGRNRPRLPLYVSLKDFRPTGTDVTAEDLKEYILNSVSDLNDARQTRYLRDHFDEGLDAGTWFILLDSFDEIPELLSAVEVNLTIRKYANAIAAFFNGASQCRGVVASREYRGPTDDLPWPRFYIVSLSEARKRKFIRQAHLDPAADRLLRTNLPIAPRDVRRLADNPMFLGLLCEYAEHERAFPDNTHAVFESHALRAFEDQGAEGTIFGVSKIRIREVAEQFAFCMASDTGLGLSVGVPQLEAAMRTAGFPLDDGEAERVAKALQYVRLARSEPSLAQLENPPLSFSHRRFQEYFATCLVLKDPTLVSEFDLLTDGRWRETAVTVLQMHPPTDTRTLLKTADDLLGDLLSTVSDLPQEQLETSDLLQIQPFTWPPGSLHLLGLLDAGLGVAADSATESIRQKAGFLLNGVNNVGIVIDRKWALDVAGTAPEGVLLRLLRTSFSTGSAWLREGAFRQIGRVKPLPRDISEAICYALVTFAAGGRLRHEWPALKAQVSNLDRPAPFLFGMRLLLAGPPVDLACHLVWAGLAMASGMGPLEAILLSALSHLSFIWLRGTTGFSWAPSNGRLQGFARLLRGLAGQDPWIDTLILAYALSILRVVMIAQTATAGLLVGLGSYGLTWAPASLLIVRLNALAHRYLALIAPQALVLQIVWWRTKRWVEKVGRWRALTRSLAVVVGLPAAIYFSSSALAAWVEPEQALPLFVGLFVVAAVAGLGNLTWVSIRYVRDWRLLRHYDRRTPATLGVDDIMALLEAFRTPAFTTRAFALLRRNRSFARSPAVRASLRDLARILEYLRVSREERSGDRSASGKSWMEVVRAALKTLAQSGTDEDRWPMLGSTELQKWIEANPKKARRRLRGLTPNFVDEVGLALEQCPPDSA